MERIQTKALVEGAIFAGVTALLGILYYYTQYLGILAMVWPVPVIIVGYRNGLKASILSAMSAGLIVSLLTHPLVGLGLLVGFGLPGILMGYMIGRKVNPLVIVFLCGIVLSFTMIGELLLSLRAAGIDAAKFMTDIFVTFDQSMDKVLAMYRQFGVAEIELQKMKDLLEQNLQIMKTVFPTALVISGVMSSFIDYKLTGIILKRIGHVIPDIDEFSRWRLKEPYSYIMLGAMILTVAASYLQLPGFTAIAVNISTIIMLVFSVIGASVFVYYAKIYADKSGIPKGLRNIITAVIILVFMQLMTYVGIADLVLNLRKLESDNRIGGVR